MDSFEHRTRGVFFFLAQPKDSNFELKSPTNMTLSEVKYGMKERRTGISIRAVNGSQSQILVVRKFKVDCQGFVFGYDIQILIPIFCLQLGHVLRGRQHHVLCQLSDLLV